MSLGTSFGWLLTIGADLQINLFHLLSKHLISFPPQPTFCCQGGLFGCWENVGKENWIVKKMELFSYSTCQVWIFLHWNCFVWLLRSLFEFLRKLNKENEYLSPEKTLIIIFFKSNKKYKYKLLYVYVCMFLTNNKGIKYMCALFV